MLTQRFTPPRLVARLAVSIAVLLTASCSNAHPQTETRSATTSRCDSVNADLTAFLEEQGPSASDAQMRVMSRIIINNPNCFKAGEVAAAQEYLDGSNRQRDFLNDLFR